MPQTIYFRFYNIRSDPAATSIAFPAEVRLVMNKKTPGVKEGKVFDHPCEKMLSSSTLAFRILSYQAYMWKFMLFYMDRLRELATSLPTKESYFLNQTVSTLPS